MLRNLFRADTPIPEKKLTWLGRHSAYDYARFEGQEFAVTCRAWDADYKLRDGERFITRTREERLEDGAPWTVTAVHLATPVASGSWEAIERRRSAKVKDSQPRVWDALAAYRRTSDVRRIPLRVSANPDVGALKAEIGMDEPSPWLELAAFGLADTSPSGLVDYLQRRGITLELARGRLVARSASPINIADRQLLDLAEPLLVGELGGAKPMCSRCAEPAVTVVLPRAPMCAEHAQ